VDRCDALYQRNESISDRPFTHASRRSLPLRIALAAVIRGQWTRKRRAVTRALFHKTPRPLFDPARAGAEERRGVAPVAYFFFLAATFFFGDALFLAGFDVFLAICFSFFAAVVLTGGRCVPSAHLHLGRHYDEL
jgi:hypothetical protein